MKLLEHIDRINRLHALLKKKRTGTPEQLAQKLHVSVSRLYAVVEELKLMGAPITYSRQLQTYYYEYDFEMSVEWNFKPLLNDELKKINAGIAVNIFIPNYQNIFPTLFFV